MVVFRNHASSAMNYIDDIKLQSGVAECIKLADALLTQ